MTGFWIVAILMLLSLGGGLMVGTSWTVHTIDRRFRLLAAERQELNERRRALQEKALNQRTASGALAR